MASIYNKNFLFCLRRMRVCSKGYYQSKAVSQKLNNCAAIHCIWDLRNHILYKPNLLHLDLTKPNLTCPLTYTNIQTMFSIWWQMNFSKGNQVFSKNCGFILKHFFDKKNDTYNIHNVNLNFRFHYLLTNKYIL